MALACEPPSLCGRPIEHWTTRELADEAAERGIAVNISCATVHRFLEEADLKPHRSRYWLNTKEKDPATFAQQVSAVCEIYQQAQQLAEQGHHVVSVDEKTGIQALERIHCDHPMRAGKPRLIEHEYRRHGTQCLIAGLNVATGEILGSVGSTRCEDDFAAHVRRHVDLDPEARWTFVMDQLNTHKSEALVRLVASRCGLTDDLGEKAMEGILKNMESRAKFLADPDHRIRFVYTPKHTSWLNQIEIWFSILVRKLLRRSSFKSLEHLRNRLLEFIDYFNETMAKPFKWSYMG